MFFALLCAARGLVRLPVVLLWSKRKPSVAVSVSDMRHSSCAYTPVRVPGLEIEMLLSGSAKSIDL